MEGKTMAVKPQVKDLATLSDKELMEEMKRRNEAKTNDRLTYQKLVAEVAPEVVKELMNVSSHLTYVKGKVFNRFKEILELKEDIYGFKSSQQSHTFSTDECSITFGYRVNISWDDTTQIGIDMIKNYLKTLSKDPESAFLVDSLNNLMKPDKNGNLKPSKVLEMQQSADKYQIPELLDAVKIIVNGMRKSRSNWFVEATVKAPDGTTQSVPLNISAVDFPSEFSFDFLNSKTEKNAQ